MAQEVQISKPRLPYHPALQERLDCSASDWRALTDAIFPNAKTVEGVILALTYCKARKLDIMKKPVNIVPMWSRDLKREVETVWPSITETRITASRTGRFGGNDACEFGELTSTMWPRRDEDGKENHILVHHFEWARMTVYLLRGGMRLAVVGPKVYWSETFSSAGKYPWPNDRWKRAPNQMLEKCAEAAALRRAFPEECGELTAEEMEGKLLEASMQHMDAPTVAARPTPPEPARRHARQAGLPPPDYTDATIDILNEGNATDEHDDKVEAEIEADAPDAARSPSDGQAADARR